MSERRTIGRKCSDQFTLRHMIIVITSRWEWVKKLVTVCSRFTAKCAACSVVFQRSDLVMRARHLIFHVDCFRCAVCERRLAAGDQFALTPGDRLCCRDDLDSDVTSAGSYDVTAVGKCDATSNTTDDEVTTSSTPTTSGAKLAIRQLNNNNENETKTTVNSVSGEL